jgi:GxxExxY protein
LSGIPWSNKLTTQLTFFNFQVKTKSIIVSENEIAEQIICGAIEVHKDLGPGLPESVYEPCVYANIFESGLFIERQKPVPLVYDEVKLDCGLRADLVVERKVVVGIKSVESLDEIHFKQILTHLRLLDLRVGLLMNFNVVALKKDYGELKTISG